MRTVAPSVAKRAVPSNTELSDDSRPRASTFILGSLSRSGETLISPMWALSTASELCGASMVSLVMVYRQRPTMVRFG